MEFNLKKILSALLFSTAEALSVKDIQAVITRYHNQAEEEMAVIAKEVRTESDGVGTAHTRQAVMQEVMAQVPSLLTASQIRDTMAEIAQELIDRRDTVRLLEGPNGWRLTVSPDYADWVRLLRDQPKPLRLSSATLETLAVVAYRQPVTRAELEAIRGVASDSAVNNLLEKELVQVIGRADLPGRPIQYGTTEKFLDFCGLRSIEELPASDVLSPNTLTDFIRKATQPQIPLGDADMGLADEKPTGMENSFDKEPDSPASH
ncbi:MAG: SMC-Scp complex subunit ScpB [Verrucomicrobiota bacterium]|nr:SMC-Scp complex subunit ScpB [Verrucomicrobiota bacterium]